MIMITTWYNKYITGRQGVLAEMAGRAWTDKPITHSWFRRCCRRNGLGSIETRNWLYDECIVNSRVFPLKFQKPIEFHTYSQWQLRGFQVMKDEQAAYKNRLGDPIFHNHQVVEK